MAMARSFKLFHTLFLVFAWQCCAKVAAIFDDVTGVVDHDVDHEFSFRAFTTHGIGILSVSGSIASTIDPQSPAAAPGIAPFGFETSTNGGDVNVVSLDLETQMNGGGSVVSRGLETAKKSDSTIVSRGLATPKISGGAVSGGLKTSSQSSGDRVVSRGLATPKSSSGRFLSRGLETSKSSGGAVVSHGVETPQSSGITIVSHCLKTHKINSDQSTVSVGGLHGNNVDEGFDGQRYNIQPELN